MFALHIMAKRRPVCISFQVRKGQVFAMIGIGKKHTNEEQDPGDTFVIAIIKTRLYQEQTILPLILCTK